MVIFDKDINIELIKLVKLIWKKKTFPVEKDKFKRNLDSRRNSYHDRSKRTTDDDVQLYSSYQ